MYNLLLGLLGRAKLYVDAAVHGTTKLVQYFSFMTYCLISKTEKLMFSGYFMDLWNLFQVSGLGGLKGLCLLWEELTGLNETGIRLAY